MNTLMYHLAITDKNGNLLTNTVQENLTDLIMCIGRQKQEANKILKEMDELKENDIRADIELDERIYDHTI